ncbi:hypothetical protein GCM10027294_25580 [Marinactinospora endophytica]
MRKGVGVVAGTRGPVPKRSDQRRRMNKAQDDGTPVEITRAPAGSPTPVPAPPANESWHPIARAWYDSLAASGQAVFYEASDWATAALLAESISRDLSPQVVGTTESGEILRDTIPLKGASLSAYLKGMSSLLVTEGDRRRARVELQRGTAVDDDEDAAVVAIDEWQSKFAQ